MSVLADWFCVETFREMFLTLLEELVTSVFEKTAD